MSESRTGHSFLSMPLGKQQIKCFIIKYLCFSNLSIRFLQQGGSQKRRKCSYMSTEMGFLPRALKRGFQRELGGIEKEILKIGQYKNQIIAKEVHKT